VDGDVDRFDFLALQEGFGQQGAMWRLGDFNGDGGMNSLDYLTWKSHAGEFIEGFSPHSKDPQAPEPGALSLLALGGLALLRRRRG